MKKVLIFMILIMCFAVTASAHNIRSKGSSGDLVFFDDISKETIMTLGYSGKDVTIGTLNATVTEYSVAPAAYVTANSSHRVTANINGTNYWILLHEAI